jgi:rare lipoprotein A
MNIGLFPAPCLPSGGLALVLLLVLTGCASSPTVPAKTAGGGYYLDDGPPLTPPANLDAVPDAVPRKEPLHPFANRVYVALGETYTPTREIGTYREEGLASWYGKRFHGKRTASGEYYDIYAMTAAHPTLPIPSYVRVTRLSSGKSVVVRINDRGPFHSKRIIDLSYTAAHKLGMLGSGSARVRVESIDPGAETRPEGPDDARPELPVEAVGAESGLFWQIGAFASEAAAQAQRQQALAALQVSASRLAVIFSSGLHRVQFGPFASAQEARDWLPRLRAALGIEPVKVSR